MERITVTQAQHIAPPILLSVGSLLPDKAKPSAAPEKISNLSHFQSSRISQFRHSVNGHLNVVRSIARQHVTVNGQRAPSPQVPT
jgi:sorbitol-specific phosphotransferase system component IIC